MRQILVEQLKVKAVVVGDNFRFGAKQAGDVKFLREMGMREGFEVVMHPPVMLNGKVVSSTLVPEISQRGGRAARGATAGTAVRVDGRSGEWDRDGKEIHVSDAEFEAGAGIAAGSGRIYYANGAGGGDKQSPERDERGEPANVQWVRLERGDTFVGLFREFCAEDD